ncbi:hypothetical protein N658DRAFT_486464 [Parathielavia hyrcaniae]|uniref:Steroid 5-alpha reductase C-terminal domain-containing protein n=1 Tax=Parathielavia hyrcaniae TaxID=113614 RepID=A0AAN6T1Z7_9PEZI|nr:hypothetical protein N658DRAFT_486464 [Parathielavia hyrcaniae]
MVIRKPVPSSATLDPAVPQEVRGANNTEEETVWQDGAQRQEGEPYNTYPAPPGVPNSLRPGGATNFSSLGEEGNIWAEGIPALSAAGDPSQGSSHGKGADTSQGTLAGQEPDFVPALLRPGGGSKPETNPFKRKMSRSAGAGQGAPTTSSDAPSVPVADFSQLSVNDTSTNPWQPAPDENKSAAPPPVPRLPEQDSAGDNVWASAKPSRQPTPGPASDSAPLLSLPQEDGSAGWEEESKTATVPPPLISTADEDVLEGGKAWDDRGTVDKGKGIAQPPPVPDKGAAGGGGWDMVDVDTRPGPPSRQSSWENFNDEGNALAAAKTAPATGQPTTVAPHLPPRRSSDQPPPKPPRPVDKSETYQIKNINWYDATAAKNPRTSPILVQNANGPCPLVALVNALTLTTPADKTNTALVETLRSREQVSLGLLLDAVFDELMSERRTQPDIPLPDVAELYEFLKGLHTGMNVNPRFIPAPEVVTAFRRTSLTHIHPTERIDMIPGTFEHTQEMTLYSTFAIPLIHGWLPSKDDAVYEALARHAVSYEDVQNLLFREEELEEKLCSPQGLVLEEQQLYQDILTIKSFLSISATQLTRVGLDVIRKAMKPGTVAILFRNDHFATLYRHPQTLELLTLVTDAGYAGHAEVVWESLVDINGESADFFSGDFRLVGGATHDVRSGPSSSHGTVPENWTDALDDDVDDGNSSEWTTVQPRHGRNATPARDGEPPLSPKYEQEDRDLALALQLQEEEDERARLEQDRRRRESLLSEQFIEQQGRPASTSASAMPSPRGGGGGNRAGGPPRARGPTAAVAASRSTTSLTSTASSTRRGPTPMQPGAAAATRPASTSVSSIATNTNPNTNPTTTTSDSNTNASTRPTTQTVRSLLPPLRTARPGGGASAGGGGGAEDEEAPPPSYEQAAKLLPTATDGSSLLRWAVIPAGENLIVNQSTLDPARLNTHQQSIPSHTSIFSSHPNFPPSPNTRNMASSPAGLIPGWFPPTRENYDLILSIWVWFPVAASLQWLTSWYGMGKTSVTSRLNLPGRIGWLTMEVPGFLTLLYHMHALHPPSPNNNPLFKQLEQEGLPWQNKVLAALFVLHYSYRALLFPFLQPSMSPLHLAVWLSGFAFQVINGAMLGSWLAAYGPTTQADWDRQHLTPPPLGTAQFAAGITIFYLGLTANYYHDDELREIRRRVLRRQRRQQQQQHQQGKTGSVVDKHYEIPQAGLFKVMLYPHYFVEWVEWFGFWMAAGWGCVPARCFLFNEIAAMLPRAVSGRRWYVERFGEDKVKGRWAVIPGVW